MFNLLIIDLDGTLVDSRLDITNALNDTLRKFDLPLVEEDHVAKHVGVGIRPIISEVVPATMVHSFFIEFENIYLENISIHTKLYEGWEHILSLPNIHKVILTNKLQKFSDKLVSNLQLKKYFDKVYGREAFQECKPSPQPILEIQKIYNVSATSTMIIGDTENDIIAGKRAGVITCGVSYGYSSKEQIKDLKPDLIIHSPSELKRILTTEKNILNNKP